TVDRLLASDDAGGERPAAPAIPADGETESAATPPMGSGEIAARAGDVLIWESGDSASMAELIGFLGLTGVLERHGRAAVARFALEGNPVEAPEGAAA